MLVAGHFLARDENIFTYFEVGASVRSFLDCGALASVSTHGCYRTRSCY